MSATTIAKGLRREPGGTWRVLGRSNKYPVAGVRFIKGDANDVARCARRSATVDLVVNALNLPYAEWDKGRKVAQTERVIAAMGTSGKTLLFPGNIYNYAASDRVVTPASPQRPQTARGAPSGSRWKSCTSRAARRGDMQVIIIRAGDFFGPESQGDWFDLAMMTEAKAGKLKLMGVRGVGHAWRLPAATSAARSRSWPGTGTNSAPSRISTCRPFRHARAAGRGRGGGAAGE